MKTKGQKSTVLIPLFRSMFQISGRLTVLEKYGMSLNPFIQVYVSNMMIQSSMFMQRQMVLIPLFRSMFQIYHFMTVSYMGKN